MRFAPSSKLLGLRQQLLGFLKDDYNVPPIGVEISPTNWCNAKCPWCFYVGQHTKEELSEDLAYNLVLDLQQMGVKAITWTGGGDPSLFTYIDTITSFARATGFQQGIFTNGYRKLEFPENFDWIRITVTEKYVITKNVADYAKYTKVGVNFNICAENADMLEDMIVDARDAGVHYFQIRPALMTPQEKIHKPLWAKKYETADFKIEFSEYKWDDYLQRQNYPYCHGHRIVPFIWHNGDVATCAYHFGRPDYIFGNLNQNPFPEIWKNRRRVVKVIPECQHCCKLHEINKVLALIENDVDPAEDRYFP